MADTAGNTVTKVAEKAKDAVKAPAKKARAKRGEGVYKTSLYHVYKRDEKKALVLVKDVVARNANLAGAQVVEQNPKLAGVALTVVPDRNQQTFTYQAETKTRVVAV